MPKYSLRFKYILGISLVLLIASSCKKKKAFNEESGQVLVDVTLIRAQNDLVLVDANDAISGQFFLRGKSTEATGTGGASSFSTCALLVDTSQIYMGKLYFNYTGNSCNNLKREGQVQITIQNYPTNKWKDKGTVLKIEFNNYVVTNLEDNKSIKFTGTEYITNESGGTWYDLKFLNQSSVIQAISGSDMKITFDKTDAVFYNVGRRITYTINGNIISGSSEGISSVNNLSNVDCWGTTREEKDFTNQIGSAIVWNTKCTALKPTSGQAKVKVDGKYFDLIGLYGTDSEGNVLGTNDCAYGWKVSWSLRSNTKKRVFNY